MMASDSLPVATSGKLAFITGGSRGLGFATAQGLRDAGFRIVIFSQDPEKQRAAKEALACEGELVDFQDIESTERVVADALAKYGTPEVFVIAHGVMSAKMSKTLVTDIQEWRRVLSINLDAVFTMVRIVGSAMYERRQGRIIVYSACLGRMSGPGNAGGLAPYRISKAGVNALVRNFSHEIGHGSRGVWIDAICPNHSRTDMGGPHAPRSAEEGAACAIWLSTREIIPGESQTGVLWEDNEVIPW
jgi:3-oxoacyl-[acyl-carrier protein] reductase